MNLTIKKHIFCTFLLFIACISLHAQGEASGDTIHIAQDERISLPANNPLPTDVKNFGGFLLDMGLKNAIPPFPFSFKLEVPDASKDYSHLFRLDSGITYTQGPVTLFSSYPGNGFYGDWNPWGNTDNLQMGSFLLKNGWRINTYGQYDKDGWRVPSPSALPWEKNNFKGAFELKSSNGAFGIRIEVQQGRKTPY